MGNRFSLKTIKKICCATTAAVALLLQMTGTAYAAGDVNMPSEPNGTFEQANPITVNTDVTDTFESENDVDCYGFSISKPGSVTLRYSTYVYKYNPSWSVSMNVYRGPAKSASYVFDYSHQEIYSGSGISISTSGNDSGHLDYPGDYYVCLTGSPTAPLTHTLNVQYSEDVYNVEYSPNNGESSNSQRLFYGDLATAPANPSRPGYTFQGWYTAPDGGEKWDFNKPVTGSMTLYAHWKANAYTVSFDANGGKASASSKMVVYDAAYGELPSASREGYSFAGWFTDRSGGERIAGDSVYSTPGDSTLYAHWAVNMVMVTYHMNDGSGASGGHEVAYGSVETEAPGPLREGYSFQGWYTAAQGGSKYDFSRPVTGDLDLYAHWKALPQLTRLAGDTRYDTMSRIVQAGGWKTGGTVVVASGSNYPDALAASGLSGVLNAPVVLTDGKVLSEQAADRIRELAPSKIVVAGGPAALSYGVETALASLCPKVDRVYGDTRVDTSLELYRAGGSRWGDTAIVATGANYADALSVSSYAYHAKAPVFLCDPSTGLTAARRTALNGFKHVLVVGGEAAVPSSYVAGLSDVVRLQGATRYETSVEIARWASSNGLHMDGAVFATGANFPDALAAGPLAGVNGGVVLLVDGPSSPAVSYATAYKGKVDSAYVVGGEAAVSRATADSIADRLGLRRAQ